MLSCCFTSDKPATRPTIAVRINGQQVGALLDTGSSVTLLDSSLKQTLLRKGSNMARPVAIRLCGADGRELVNEGCYSLEISFGKRSSFYNVMFIHKLQVPCIIGMDVMSKAGVVIDTASGCVNFSNPMTVKGEQSLCLVKTTILPPKSETQVKLKCNGPFTNGLLESDVGMPDETLVMDGIVNSEIGGKECLAVMANFSHLPVKILSTEPVAKLTVNPNMKITPLRECLNINSETPVIKDFAHVDSISLEHIPNAFKSQYSALLREYSDVFSKNDLDIGHCKSLPHQVRLTDPNKVVSINQYRMPHHLKEVAIDYVQRLLAAGVVRKSNSVFNSPLMLVKKPHADPSKPLAEQYRLVHNYVEVNKNISPCSYPLRHLYELLDEVAGGTVYSVLDLSQGFFQQHLVDPHEATAFSIPGVGQYSYCRSPQGMNSSPAYFQRLLDFVLEGIKRTYVYIDDVVVSVNSHEQNLDTLRLVFSRFRKHNLKVKPSKCQFGTAKITYLGYDICTEKGISPGQAKTEVIRNWPCPKSIREIRGFLGLTSFFRRAIKDFSIISSDLNKLVRKDSGYTNGPLPEKGRISFQNLQKALISKPCLAAVDFNKEFYLTCDASATHYGACLSQKNKQGIEQPCAYASKLLNEREAKQAPGFREKAALLFAMRHFNPYLVGREFVIRTDHKPNLAITKGKTAVYDTLTDEILSYLPFRLEYLNGSKMFADILSRPPGYSCNAVTWDQSSHAKLMAFHDKVPTTLTNKEAEIAKTSSVFKGILINNEGLVIPPHKEVTNICQLAHDNAGHMSAQYTLQHIRKTYCWPGMERDVIAYVKSCEICSRSNAFRPAPLQALQPLQPFAKEMGDRIHIDLVDMPRSHSNNIAICTLVDAATGFIITNPVKDKTSNGVTETLLDKFMPYFGCPKVLVTDKGKENVNKEIELLCNKYNIKHIISSTYHPQSNGMVERRQGMILSFLRKLTTSYADQGNWDKKLSDFQLITNSTVSKARGYSPFFLTFFKHPNYPFQSTLHSEPNYNQDSLVADKFNMSRETLKTAFDNSSTSFTDNAKQFDKAVRPSKIKIGDLVYLRSTQRGKMHHKIAQPFKGPYTCTDILTNNNLELVPLAGGKTVTAHSNNCKLGFARPDYLRLYDPLSLSSPPSSSDKPTSKNTPVFIDDEDNFFLPNIDLDDDPAAPPDIIVPEQPEQAGADGMDAPPPPPDTDTPPTDVEPDLHDPIQPARLYPELPVPPELPTLQPRSGSTGATAKRGRPPNKPNREMSASEKIRLKKLAEDADKQKANLTRARQKLTGEALIPHQYGHIPLEKNLNKGFDKLKKLVTKPKETGARPKTKD